MRSGTQHTIVLVEEQSDGQSIPYKQWTVLERLNRVSVTDEASASVGALALWEACSGALIA
jgi:hypothetical protein